MKSHERAADAETGQASPQSDVEILQPLQLLLAARRGVRQDPDCGEIDIPNKQNISFFGKSGVACINKRWPWWTQPLICFGYFNGTRRVIASILLFLFASDVSRQERGAKNRKIDSDSKPKREGLCWQGFRIGLIAAGTLFLVFTVSKRVINKRMTNSPPPHLDPLSYQFRLTAAMDQRGWHYEEVVAVRLAELEKIWTRNKGISEKFTIKGLRYPATDNWVYDVDVVFNFDDEVRFSFPKAIPANGVSSGAVTLS